MLIYVGISQSPVELTAISVMRRGKSGQIVHIT